MAGFDWSDKDSFRCDFCEEAVRNLWISVLDKLSTGILYKMTFKTVNLGDMKITVAYLWVQKIPSLYSA